MTKLTLIAAMSRNRVIGVDGKLPWKIPEDLKLFKQITLGQVVVMGRKTWESLGCRPLTGRTNVVVSRSMSPGSYALTNYEDGITKAYHVGSIPDALRFAEAQVDGNCVPLEVFIIGGGELYAQTIADADRLILTQVDIDVEGDTVFPVFDESAFYIERIRLLDSEIPADMYTYIRRTV